MDLSIYSSYIYYSKCLKFFAIFSFISHSLVVNILASHRSVNPAGVKYRIGDRFLRNYMHATYFCIPQVSYNRWSDLPMYSMCASLRG